MVDASEAMADRPPSRLRSGVSARPPAVSSCAEEFADGACEFVDDAWCQESRKTACEAEEEILVGMMPIHVQLQRDFAPQKGSERPAALRPRNGDSANRQR